MEPGQLEAGAFTLSNAFTVLLTTESLMFAALGLAANLGAASGRRVRALPLPAPLIGGFAVAVLVVIASGAAAAWGELFGANEPGSMSEWLIAGSLLIAIIAEPVLAVLLGFGLRAKD